MNEITITLVIDESNRRELVLGMYDHSQPREKLPENVRQAKLSDLEDNDQPLVGTPFLFARPSGAIYATKLTAYGIDVDLYNSILDGRVWVINNTKKNAP